MVDLYKEMLSQDFDKKDAAKKLFTPGKNENGVFTQEEVSQMIYAQSHETD